MLAELGSVFVALALAVSVYAAFAAFWAIRRADSRWSESGHNAVLAATALLGAALLMLLAAFLGDRFQIRYVAEHSSLALPLYLKASAVWAGQDGSLLLWSFLQSLFAGLTVARPPARSRALLPWAMVFLNLITVFFVAVVLFLSNPFTQLATAPPDGQGLNPLLRHPGMVFHPPATYVGYVGLAVPFAFAMAALVARRVAAWPVAAHRWTLVAWLCLGLGIMLGARWAYDVLGWGGYWGWDPVENAGLMPWLTTTALLHGLVMQEQRGGFRWWNVLLVVVSFALVLFGTFTTRSGLIVSVHAFVSSGLGPYFLAAIALALLGSLALMVSRRALLTNPRPVGGLLSRDGTFFVTLFLFLTITASVFIGSVLPTLTESMSGQRFEASPEWFDRVTGPQFALLVLLLGVCPLLGFSVSSVRAGVGDDDLVVALRRLGRRGWPGLLGAVLLPVCAALAGFTQPVSLVGFAVIGLAGATSLAEVVRGVSAHMRRRQAGLLAALWHALRHHRRKYGGTLVHTGVILIALGVIGTRMYDYETQVVLAQGESATVNGYSLVYDLARQERSGDHLSTWASLSVYRDGAYLTALQPRVDYYMDWGQQVSVPALRVGLREDLYVVLAGLGDGGATATFKVIENPLASFLWLGGLFMLAGGALALAPPMRAVRSSVPRTASVAGRAINALVCSSGGVFVALTAALLLLVAAGLAWTQVPTLGDQTEVGGAAAPAETPSAGRPLPGQLAPDFTLELLDGSALALSDLRGRVAVVSFWSTWCMTCDEQLPELQAVWADYQERERDGRTDEPSVRLVGIAFRAEETAVREKAAHFEITYPMGLDPGDRISAVYGITGVPETFVVGPDGRVAYVHVGPVSAQELRAELDSLLD